MKKTTAIIFAAALLAGCATSQPTFNATAAFDQEMMSLDSRLRNGQITEVQLAERAADMARTYFPTDYNFHSLRDYKILIAKRLERGDLSREEFDYLWSEKRNAFMAERQQINNQMTAEDDARKAAATAFMLQRMGTAVRGAYQQPGVRCTSTPMGASVSTTCY